MKTIETMIQKLIHDTRGSVLITTVFSIVLLVGLSGGAVDLGRSYAIQSKMLQAGDAAALAAASMPEGSTEAQRNQMAARFFSLNFPDNYMNSGVTSADINMSYTPDALSPDFVNLDITAPVQTSFLRLFGINTMDAIAGTTVATATSTPPPVDLVMVLDRSGSMCNPCSKRDALRTAVTNLTNTLFTNTLNTGIQYAIANVFYSTSVESFNFSDNQTYLTSLYSAEIGANGWTAGGPATIAASNFITSSARPGSMVAAVSRVAIVMSDGENNVDTVSSTGHNTNAAINNSNDEMLDACATMKSSGVLVYTIAFQAPSNAAAILRTCASEPKTEFALTPANEAQLISAFANIADAVTKIRIAR